MENNKKYLDEGIRKLLKEEKDFEVEYNKVSKKIDEAAAKMDEWSAKRVLTRSKLRPGKQ
jgi:hypothetical protein